MWGNFFCCWGEAKDLLKISNEFRDYIKARKVSIYGDVVEGISHKITLMPLALLMQNAMILDQMKSKARDPFQGHVCSKFQMYQGVNID